MGQVTREWHSRQCPRSLGTYRKPGVTGAQRRRSHTKSPGFWKSSWGWSLERGYCNPSRVWGVVGSMRRGTEEKKTERHAHAQHKQMAEQRRMPRPRAWWRQGCHMETINCPEHEVLFGSQGHAQKAPGGRAWAERMRVCVTGKDKVSRNFKKTPESF